MDLILFLNFEGCIHPDDVYHVEGKPVLRTEGVKLFEHADVLADLVSPYPELRIVLSTSWVRRFGLNRDQELLPAPTQDDFEMLRLAEAALQETRRRLANGRESYGC